MSIDDSRLSAWSAAQAENASRQGRPLNFNGGDGTSGGMGDDWKDSVNSQLAQLHGDVRNLLYGLLGAIVLIAGAGWSAYVKLSDQVTELKVGQAQIAGKLDLLNERLSKPAPGSPALKP